MSVCDKSEIYVLWLAIVDNEVVGGWMLILQVSYLLREWEDGLVDK